MRLLCGSLSRFTNCLKSQKVGSASAMPPDVRRGLPRCGVVKMYWGSAPGAGSSLKYGAKPRTNKYAYGAAIRATHPAAKP